MAKGFFIGVENFKKRELPSGYTQLEYIQSTGKQYIDTGFAPSSQDMQIDLEVEFTSAPSGCSLFGGRVTDSDGSITAFNSPIKFWVGNSKSLLSLAVSVGVKHSISVHADNGTFTASLDGAKSSTTYSGNLSSTYSVALFGMNTAGSIGYGVSARMYTCRIWDDGTLVRDYIPAKNSSGEAGLFDIVTMTFYGDVAGVGFTAGATYSSIARKVKEGFIGIDGISRKIKEAFVGIGGVARPCWTGGELKYYGTITALTQARSYLGSASIDNYAIFAGGYNGDYNGAYYNVEAYNKSLTISSPAMSLGTRYSLAAASIDNYALFAGGYTGSSAVDYVYACDTSLGVTMADVLSTKRSNFAAASTSNHVLFGGGNSSSNVYSNVDAYDTSLTRTSPTALSQARLDLAATAVGDYVLFGGGGGSPSSLSSAYSTVDAYNQSLTRTTQTALSVARHNLAATSVGDYALFGGGYGGNNSYTTVDVYNKSLTKTTATDLSEDKYYLAATSVGDCALFGGGYTSNSGSYTGSSTVDVYDTSLTRTIPTGLSVARRSLAAASIDKYALFAGGYGNGGISYSSTVDAYVVA